MGLIRWVMEKINIKRPKVEIKGITLTMHNDSQIPPMQDDYAKTVFLSWFSKPKINPCEKGFPQYFLYECGIKDCSYFLMRMKKEGLITEATKERQLSALKTEELKMFLADLGLQTSGKKVQLIDRILREAPEERIEALFDGKTIYCLSFAGNMFVHNHEQYVILHKHRDWLITWQEFDAAHRPDVGIYDTIWGLLNKRCLNEAKVNGGRNALVSMSECAMERGNPELALSLLLQVLAIDICQDPFFGFAPGILSRIVALGDYYHLGMLDAVFCNRPHAKNITKAEFAKIIESIISGEIDIDNVEKNIRKCR